MKSAQWAAHTHRAPALFMALVAITLIVVFLAPAQADQNSARVIENSDQPESSPTTLELKELWRAGDEDSEVIFGHIFRAEADAQGNIYLLDTQQSNVPVFSPTGQYLRTLSRQGEGPGETTEPVDLTMMPDGTLGILQRFPGKVVKVTKDDIPAGDIEIGDPTDGGFSVLYTGRHRNGNLILVGLKATNTEQQQKQDWFVSRFDSSGKELARCFETTQTLDNANPVLSELWILNPILFGSTVGPDGRTYVSADHDNYAIQVFSPEGALLHTVKRDFKARPKTTLERDRLQSVFDVWSRGRLETHLEKNALTVGDIYIDDENSMWVRHSRSGCFEKGATGFQFDVFNSEGVFTRQVTLACDVNPADDQIYRVSDHVAVVVKGSIPALFASMAGGEQELSEDESMQEMEVICYQIP